MALEFDLIIIGGGIIGAGCALEASSAGLKVLLLEKSDFGSQTSAGSFKIIHGGLRYLQHFDFSRLRESYKEQQYLRRAAPHLLKPLPFIVPCYGYGMKGKAILSLACSIYEFLARSRNEAVEEGLHLPEHTTLTKEQLLKIAPHLSQKGLKGGVVFYDCQMQNPDRLTLAVIKAAESRGAVVKNYNEVIEVETKPNAENITEITNLVVKDVLSGAKYKVSAKVYINALGPSASQFGKLFKDKKVVREVPNQVLSKGIQLVLPPIIKDHALSIEGKGRDTASSLSRGKRAFFLQPWKNHTLAGTTDTIFKGNPEDFKIGLSEIKEFLEDLREAYPAEELRPINVKYAFGGLRPVDARVKREVLEGVNRDGMVNTSRDEEIYNHATELGFGLAKVSNLISVAGIKYTTFRSVAERVVGVLNSPAFLGHNFKIQVGLSKNVKLGGEDVPSLKQLTGLCLEEGFKCKEEDLTNLIESYGDRALDVLKNGTINAKRLDLSPLSALYFSQTEFAVKFEDAKCLTDIIMRRMSISSFGFPGHTIVDEISRYAAHFLGWEDSKRQEEILKVNSKFTFGDKS